MLAQGSSPCLPDLLTVGTDCSSPTSGSVSGFTNNTIFTNCNGLNGSEPQGFYSFVATDASMTIEVTGASGFDAVVELLEGSSCVSLTNIACEDNVGSGGTETVNATGLTIGDTYTVAVYDWFGDNTALSTFDICVYGASGTANTTPTDIALSANTIDENTATGTTVGSFSTTDADTADAHTYSLVAGTGDTNNASFTIDGADLKTNAAIDYETNTTLSIRVQTNDGTDTFEKEITITVNDLDETPPTVVTQDITVQLDANGSASITAGQIDNGSSDASGNVTLSLGASSLQAGFNDATLDSGFELVNGADWVSGISGSGNLNGEFVAKKTSSGRKYLRTVASDFINYDFEVTFTYDDINVNSGGDILTFLGIGDPSVTDGNTEPNIGIFLRDHSNPYNGADQIASRFMGVSPSISTGSISEGIKRVKIVKSGTQITFFIDSGNSGTFPANGQGFDLTSAGSNFLDDTNSYIFFGSGSTNVQLDDISITYTKQPGAYDCSSLGQNTVNLVVTDGAGNSSTATATVTVEDNIAPTISLTGDASVTHEALTPYTDLGATTADNC